MLNSIVLSLISATALQLTQQHGMATGSLSSFGLCTNGHISEDILGASSLFNNRRGIIKNGIYDTELDLGLILFPLPQEWQRSNPLSAEFFQAMRLLTLSRLAPLLTWCSDADLPQPKA